MKPSCRKNYDLELFSPKRLVFEKGPEKQKEAVEQPGSKPGEKPTLQEKYEKNADKLKTPVVMNSNIDTTMKELAAKIDGDATTQEQIKHAFIDAYEKTEIPPGKSKKPLKEFWQDLAKAGWKISIIKENGDWAFKLENKEKETTLKQPLSVDVEPKKETPPGKPGEMRMIDEEAEKAEKERIQKEEEGKVVREKVYGNKDDVSGKIHYKKGYEKEIGAVYVKLDKIYPDARKGDRVLIRDYNGAKKTAEYNGEKFEYVKPASLKGKEAKVRWNYRLTFIPNEDARTAEKPKPPEGLPHAGYFRVKENMSWYDIAKKALSTPDIPDGRDVTQGAGGPVQGNPAQRLNKLGYDRNNEQDIKAYANILREHNGHDKLYVWLVIPKNENPRIAAERVKKQQESLKKEATERSKKRESGREKNDRQVMSKHWKKMVGNERYTLKGDVAEILDNDELWNYYWEQGHLKGKAQIKRGLDMLNVPMGKQRDFLRIAVQEDRNDRMYMEDFFAAAKELKINMFKNKDKEAGDFDDWHDETYFYQVATYIKKGKKVSAEAKEFYNDNYEEYVTKAGVIDVELKYNQLVHIGQAAALVLEGLTNLKTTQSIEHAEAAIKVAEEKKEKREEKGPERAPWNASTPEDRFLQQFFHPKNTKSLEEITSADTLDEDKSDFENRYSEETAYQMIRLQAADPSNPKKIDRGKMVNIMNGYIRTALARFFNLKRMIETGKGEDKKGLQTQLEEMAQRYFGTKDLNKLDISSGKGTEMERALNRYEFPLSLSLGTKEHTDRRRNMVHDGFLASREIADGKVKLGEEITENKEWTNYSEILESAKNEGTREIVMQLAATNPKFAQLSKEEFKKAVEDIDAFMEKKHDWKGEGFDHGIDDLKMKDNRLFDINAGVNANTGDWYLGLSKEILNLKLGKDTSLGISLGIAVNPKTGEVLIGALVGLEHEFSKQWSANVKGAAGVEVTKPKIAAGVSGGFTWMSKGSKESPWRDKVDFGAGVGSSISFNLTDVYLGPYVYVGYGQKKDFQEQASKLYTNAYLRNRFDMVDTAGGTKEKAIAIQKLPRGVGEFMFELKHNLGWTDQELVNFYEQHMKNALKNMSMNKALESASGISEWGIGATLDPIKLGILAASLASGNPVVMGAVALGVFGKLGIIVGSSIKVERKLSDGIKEEQIAYEQKVVEEINKMFPTVNVSYEVLRFKDMENVDSRTFAGSKLQRMLGLPPDVKPTSVEKAEFNPEKTDSFQKLQAEFAKHKLILSYDKKEKSYSIEPTMTQTYRMYIDPDIAKGYGLAIKGQKILIAAKEDLSNLHIRRFDVFYPGYVEGANQHTVITISDNPYVKMTNLAQQESFIEVKYDRERGINGTPEKVGSQKNLYTYSEFKNAEGLYTATVRTEKAKMSAEEKKKHGEAMSLTAEAFTLPKSLPEAIDLSSLPMSPEKFSKHWRYRMLYRKLTTIPPGGTAQDYEKLDTAIKKENPDITEDQLILYKERLFSLSMSEQRFINRESTIKRRIEWARNAVFVPFFKRKMAEKPGAVPKGISAEDLADAFLDAVGEHIKDNPQKIEAGQAIFTSVGTMYINGIRMVEAASGQNNQNNEFVEAVDYAKFLSAKGADATKEQRAIAQLLLSEHAEIPKEDTAFLQSRLAKKLFYMGKENVPNPLVQVIGAEKFKQLIAAYKAIEAGQEAPASSAEGIQALREIAEKIQQAQLSGQPVIMDGNRPGRAVTLGDYVFVIETTLKSGIYEFCKNPSVLYDESITVFSLPKLKQQVPEMAATIVSGAGDTVALETRTAEVWSIGLNAIGKYEIKPEVQQEAKPPKPGTPPGRPPRIPVKPRPSAGPGGKTTGETGGDTQGGAGQEVDTPQTGPEDDFE